MVTKKNFVSSDDGDNLLLTVYFRVDEETRKVHAFKSIIPLDIDKPYEFPICCEYEIFDIDEDTTTERLSNWGKELIETALPK